MKILIVEDDFICAKVLKIMLTEYGEVSLAEDGAIGVEAVKKSLTEEKPFDLVCLDIMMPNMNGHEALKLIRDCEREHGYNIGQGTKILMTTALSDHKNVMQSFKEECDGYVIKPVDKSAIAAKLKEIGLL